MKHLSILILGAMLCAGITGCQEDSQSVSTSDPSFGVKPGSGGGGGNASPAIVYSIQEFSKGKQKYNLQVCDADGANQTTIVYGADELTRYWGQPTWSGTANAISYIVSDTGRTTCTLKTVGVSVVGGKATAGTTTTLLTVSRAGDHKAMAGGIWSPTAGEIAYSLQDANTGTVFTRKSDIYVIPSSGGTPELIYSTAPGTSVYHMSWNSAGTKLALLEWEMTGDAPLTWTSYIKIIDRSTGAVDQTINISDLGMNSPSSMGWSRSGLNTIAFYNNTGTVGIYTIDLDNPASVSLVQASAYYPAWSPDNSKLIYYSSGGLTAETLSSGATTTLVPKYVTLPFWKP
jgi:Tol biopolymer transport system component